MQTARLRLGSACGLAALLLLAPLAAAPQDAQQPPAALAVGVVATQSDPQLQQIALGYGRWLAAELGNAGIAVVPLDGPPDAALAAAHAQGLTRLLAPRLDAGEWKATIQLPLYAPESGALLGGARAEQPLAELGSALASSLDALRSQLGVAPSAPTPAPLLDDLASSSRALAAWQADDWVRAWTEVQGRLTPTAMALREEIVDAARRNDGPLHQRARLLAAAGDVLAAARLIGREAVAALHAETADLALLVAGGDLALARNDAAVARASFERVLAVAPDDAPATLGLARALALQGDAAGARQAWTRAAQLDPADPLPWTQLAESERDVPQSAARHWLEAGRRSAQQLEVQRAQLQIERAIALDSTLAGEASLATGALEERLGRPSETLAAYRRAATAGIGTPEVLVATGRAQRALGQSEPARLSLESALAAAPQHPAAMSELGALYLETGRPALALPLLEAARAADAKDRAIRQRYARALQASGKSDAAVALLIGEDATRPELELAAEIEMARGDLGAARGALTRAVAADPLEPTLRAQNAKLLDSLGDAAAATSERQIVALLQEQDGRSSSEQADHALGALSLDELVTSFAAQVPRASEQRVIFLGTREPNDWRTLAWRWLRTRGPDPGLVNESLQIAIEGRFGKLDALGADGSDVIAGHIDRLYAFEQQGSLDAQTIAAVNQVLGSDAIFVGRIVARAPSEAAELCDPGDFALELRLLSGRDPELVSALANLDCVRGGFASYGAWNWPGFVLYALAALLLGWPLIRGWGAIDVSIKLPERTKGFFSIHITRRADAVKKQVDRKSDRTKMKAGRLDFLKRFERHMAERETHFRWIPARKLPYTVTVAGPLLDARGEEIIGHFLEEQRVAVSRGMASKLIFDFCPRECAVEVRIAENGQPAAKGRVAVEGDPSSLRFARDGVAYLYLGPGRYTILVGSGDSAAGLPLEIQSVENAIPLRVDFADDTGLVFRGCPEAVEAFLQSDLASAAAALERHGQAEAAHRMRAALYRRQGRHAEAAREFEAGGQLENAAEMRASGSDFGGSAELFEQAGDFARAAEAYHAAGAFADAARCYELAYDYPRAVECWREIGDRERELELQEKLGEYLEAARLARELGDTDRALSLLGQVDTRHAAFAEACRCVAEIASERGEHDLAASKLEEAIGEHGAESASIDLLEAYAGALERAERNPQALSAYEILRRRDASRSDVSTHIQRLRQEIASASVASTSSVETAPPRRAGAPQESRYEILGELGRGGMGVVYKARDKRLGRVVALKRLPENLKHHPQAVSLFEREARAAAALNHRNIVTLFDAGEEDGAYFISMELLEGRPLNAILAKSGRLRAGDVIRLGVQICAGLQIAHERRIVHRDIKAANLFFTHERVVKIMDFGIAKSLEEVRRQATVIGGTPYYMAPEQAAGQQVDHRADLYALGVTFYQLVTGELPFADGDVSYRHRHEAPPDPRMLTPELPERFVRLILALMGKRPEDRPASAEQVSGELRALHSEMSGKS